MPLLLIVKKKNLFYDTANIVTTPITYWQEFIISRQKYTLFVYKWAYRRGGQRFSNAENYK